MVEEGFGGRGVTGEKGDSGVEQTKLMDEGTAYKTCATC